MVVIRLILQLQKNLNLANSDSLGGRKQTPLIYSLVAQHWLCVVCFQNSDPKLEGENLELEPCSNPMEISRNMLNIQNCLWLIFTIDSSMIGTLFDFREPLMLLKRERVVEGLSKRIRIPKTLRRNLMRKKSRRIALLNLNAWNRLAKR